jgi:hypothetical protein
MTIAKTGNRAQYTGDGTTVAFAYGFRFFDNTDLGVYVLSAAGVESKKVLTTDYTVTNTGTESGGTVTFNTAPATGEIVTILGEVPQTQSVDLSDNDAFPADTLEGALDRAIRLVQRIDERLNRSLVLPISTTLANITLPTPQANTAIGWNAAGNNLTNISLIDDGTPVVGTRDNGLMRYDSATQGLQDSGVIVDDSDNITGINNLTINGVFSGGISLTVVSVTGNTDVTADDAGKLFHATSTATLSLVAAATAGAGLVFNVLADGAAVTIDPDGSEQVNSATTLVIPAGHYAQVRCTGSAWRAEVWPTTAAKADQAKAEAGTDNDAYMTPLRTAQAIAAQGGGGKVLQFAETSTGAVATGTTLIPYDDTIPQITEGDEYLSLAVTPESASSDLLIEVVVHGAMSSGAYFTVALFEDGTNDALSVANFASNLTGGAQQTTCLRYVVAAGSTSARTYKVRIGGNTAGTFTLNGTGSGRRFGGRMISSLTVTEIAA